MMLHTDLCYAHSAEQLAELTGAHVTTARRWKKGAPLPEPVRRLLRFVIERELSVLAPEWSGWRIDARGNLVSPEAWTFTPGQVLSIPLLYGSISAHRGRANAAEARLDMSRQGDFIEGRWTAPGETHDDGTKPAPITIHERDWSILAPGIARRRSKRRG